MRGKYYCHDIVTSVAYCWCSAAPTMPSLQLQNNTTAFPFISNTGNTVIKKKITA
jgi:hypothetical protein